MPVGPAVPVGVAACEVGAPRPPVRVEHVAEVVQARPGPTRAASAARDVAGQARVRAPVWHAADVAAARGRCGGDGAGQRGERGEGVGMACHVGGLDEVAWW